MSLNTTLEFAEHLPLFWERWRAGDFPLAIEMGRRTSLSKFKAGDDVFVEFDGLEVHGEVMRVSSASGYVMCVIDVDPEADLGSITASLAPRSTVCVKETNVRHA